MSLWIEVAAGGSAGNNYSTGLRTRYHHPWPQLGSPLLVHPDSIYRLDRQSRPPHFQRSLQGSWPSSPHQRNPGRMLFLACL
ncbi:hypothetical protein NXS19_008556 [Fusarium pseudograminearum]|nr:hypothetical protein NXS19_008556 [Fusarium pseudograminearum]